MRIVSFGEAAESGPELLAAAVAALAFGLFPYGAFLLLARGFYALGDSRTPGLVSVAVAAVGVVLIAVVAPLTDGAARVARSEEHTSELQSLMRISYAVFCLKKKKN